ncbi:MAG: TIGR03986 family CRISPR-associated RAMP protein [Candidatus Latescibacteria bacterium]|nr:TIGR03986 family CRISPR-associated RAMP protein [Candidatus Latescibacterota bacterium]
MATGKIKKWIGVRGFGFIENDAGGPNVFLHISKVAQDDRGSLIDGTELIFDIQETPRGLAASNVRFQETSSLVQGATDSSFSDARDSFHNPYNFVPTPPRQDAIKAGGFAGDFDSLECGLSHASLEPDLWTGHLPIKLTTVTPLVLLKTDGEERSSTEHQTYDVLNYLPESSLRGMLRSAYEVVTNSRYGCFSNDDRLTFRLGREKKTYKKSPKDLLDFSLRPGDKMSELSPADRLFGWVPQQSGSGQGYKGRIRVVCEDDARSEIIQHFDGKDLPLTILGEPKPAQGRFYVAKDNKGTPQEDGISKEKAGYNKGKSLRGRKQYWHHKGLEADQAPDYWKSSVEDRTQQQNNGRYQEYRRPNKNGEPQKDSQNCSITGWIKPGTVFKASLYVQNLQAEEIGALLWLLSLPEDHYFRLGYGKPLGFGSVRMEVDEDRCVQGCLPLGTDKDWKSYYATFDTSPPATLNEGQRKDCIQKFKASMVAAYDPLPDNNEATNDNEGQDTSGKSRMLTSLADLKDVALKTIPNTPEDQKKFEEQRFDALPFISGFLQVLKGPEKDAPIHYPRLDSKPNPEGKNFEWFTNNERNRQYTLPAVTDEKGLPYQP